MLDKFVFGAAVAISLLFAPPVHATTFDFTYISGGLTGTVSISGTQNSPGAFDITSGTDTVTDGGGLNGTFTLLQNASYPTTLLSPSGFFTFNNQLTPSADLFVDSDGLLFTLGTNEVNVFSSAPGSYIHYDNSGFNVPITVSALTTIQDTINVPEPITLALLGTGLVGIGLTRRPVRRHPACG